MKYNWDWGVVFREPYFGWIVDGAMLTALISVAAFVIAFVAGSSVGVVRHFRPRFLGPAADLYISLFRNIPLLLQMFLWFYVLPEVLPVRTGNWLKQGLPQPQIWTAIVCLGFYTSVRIAEQIRAGLGALGRRQFEAAQSIGMSDRQALVRVLLPVVYRLQLPVLTNEALTIVKNSSVALTIGALELTAQARRVEEYTFQGIEAFSAVTLIYVAMTTIVVAILTVAERRLRISL